MSRVSKIKVTNLDELEEYYSKNRKIKFADNVIPNSIKDIYKKLIALDSNETCYLRNGFHCENGRNRSIDDLITLSKYYFPEKKLKQILSEIFNSIDEKDSGNSSHKAYVSYCPNIRKNNFWKSVYSVNNYEDRFLDINFSKNGFPNLNLEIKSLIK